MWPRHPHRDGGPPGCRWSRGIGSGSLRLELGLAGERSHRAQPHVDGTDLVWVEGPRYPSGVVIDAAHAERVLVGEPLRAEEIQEDRRGLGMPAGPHLDLDAVLDQEVPVAEHVVDGGDLEVHVAQPGPLALEHGQLVVDRIDPQQAGRIPDPVRHPRVEAGAPEPVRLMHVGRVQAQVTELGDAGRPGERDRPGDGLLLAHQFQAITERIVKGDVLPYPAGTCLVRRARVDGDPRAFALGLGGGQRVGVGDGEAGRNDAGWSFDQGQAVVAVVGAQMRDTELGRGGQFQADDAGGEPDRRVKVGHAGADIGDVGECDHRVGSGVDRGDVDVDLPVADQVVIVDQDVHVGDRHGLAVLAEVLDVDLRDDRVPELPHVPDVVGQAVDAGEEPGDRFLDGLAAGDRVGVGEAELRVRGEVGDELVGVEGVDVGENRRYVAAHDVLPSLADQGRISSKLYAVSRRCATALDSKTAYTYFAESRDAGTWPSLGAVPVGRLAPVTSRSADEVVWAVDVVAQAEAADLLASAYETRVPVEPLMEKYPGLTLGDAYEIQLLQIRRRVASGARVKGHKVGLSPSLQPRVEPEVALVLKRPLQGPGVTVAEAVAAIDFVLPALELIDSRIRDWRIGLLDTIADNASSGGVVLGSTPTSLSAVDLRLGGCNLHRNGALACSGAGGAVLGSPLKSLG